MVLSTINGMWWFALWYFVLHQNLYLQCTVIWIESLRVPYALFLFIIIYKMEYWCLVYSKMILSCINIVFKYLDVLLKINNVFSYCNKSCVYLAWFFMKPSRNRTNLEFLMNKNLIEIGLPIFYICILWYLCLWSEGHDSRVELQHVIIFAMFIVQ